MLILELKGMTRKKHACLRSNSHTCNYNASINVSRYLTPTARQHSHHIACLAMHMHMMAQTNGLG